jgi:hypothetical protein
MDRDTSTFSDYSYTKLYLNITNFSKQDYYSDYISNPKKRITTLVSNVGEDWQKAYVIAYHKIRDTGRLLLRAKVITDHSVTLYQVYRSKKDRDNFEQAITKPAFNNIDEIDIWEHGYIIELRDFYKLLDEIHACDKKLIQHISMSYAQSGMVIGDALNGDKLFYVD